MSRTLLAGYSCRLAELSLILRTVALVIRLRSGGGRTLAGTLIFPVSGGLKVSYAFLTGYSRRLAGLFRILGTASLFEVRPISQERPTLTIFRFDLFLREGYFTDGFCNLVGIHHLGAELGRANVRLLHRLGHRLDLGQILFNSSSAGATALLGQLLICADAADGRGMRLAGNFRIIIRKTVLVGVKVVDDGIVDYRCGFVVIDKGGSVDIAF